jgi:Putative addiction module component
MKAIKQIIDVENHTFSVVLPKDFTAKRVEVIILPSNPEDDIPQWQQEESERRYNEYLQNPEIAILNEDFMKKLDAL